MEAVHRVHKEVAVRVACVNLRGTDFESVFPDGCHFRSTAQIHTALGGQVAASSASRVAVLENFADEQILQFLANHYGGDADAARARFALLGDVHDLLGLSRNPRMLSFIADLDEVRLRAVHAEHSQISAAALYREAGGLGASPLAGDNRNRP